MNRKILLILIITLSVLGIIFASMIRPKIKFDKLIINEKEWDSIVESRKRGDIYLKSIKFNDYNLIIDEKNNRIYYSVINNSASRFSPFISFVASSANARLAILDDEMTEEKIMNNHEFKIIVYDDNTYKIYGLYCTRFPMLNITCNKQNDGEFKIPMSMYLFNNFDKGINRVTRSDGIINKIEMEDGTYNYTISLIMTTPGKNKRENVLSLLHMRPSNEYFLNAINIGKIDPSVMNDIKDVKSEIDKLEREKDEREIELFINNEYIGLYSLGYNPNVNVKPKNK